MDIKKFIKKDDSADKENYYWSLVIEDGWVSAGIWSIRDDQAKIIVSTSPFAWELDEELISASDSALSTAIQVVSGEIPEPSETVFGLPSSWISGSQIKEEFLEKIKDLCSELSLKPIGFVVLPEAIAHFIKIEEGSPLSAVTIGIYKEKIEVSVFKFGNLTGTTQVARSVSLVDDVVEGLSRFSEAKTGFPSRFVLYNAREKDLEEAQQILLKVNWEDNQELKFLHPPKIEIIDAKRKIYAVSLGGASEIAQVNSILVEEKEVREPLSLNLEEQLEKESLEKENLPSKDTGFVVEKDIAQMQEEVPEKGLEEAQTEESHFKSLEFETPTSFTPQTSKALKIFNLGSYLTKFFDFVKGIPKLGGSALRPIYLAAFILIAVFLLGFLFWWFYPKAEITVYVSPKILEDEVSVKVDTNKEKDFFDVDNSLVSGEIVETQVAGESSKETTGVKIVGEKSKGSVTLYRVGSEITIPKGTLIHGPAGLDFVLDDEVTIASGSAGTPGTANVSVTASDIGSQYNLASGSRFSVGNYSTSDIEAKNESPFSGGYSKELKAVSDEDQKELRENLEKELLEKAIQQLSQNLESDKIFIKDSTEQSISKEEFSSKVGDEAENLKLSLELSVKGIVINKVKFLEVVSQKLSEKVTENFFLDKKDMNFDFDLIGSKDGVYDFTVSISANLLPFVNTKDLKERIKGNYIEVSKEILEREIPGFLRADYKIKPVFSGRLKTLPHVAENIEIELVAER